MISRPTICIWTWIKLFEFHLFGFKYCQRGIQRRYNKAYGKFIDTSEIDGEEVVQVYFRDEISSITRPVKELVAYQRVLVEKNSSKTIKFSIPVEALSYFNAGMNKVVESGEFTFMVGGSSCDDKLIKVSHLVKNNYNY